MSNFATLLAFPSSLLLAVALLLTAFLLHRYAAKDKVVLFLSSARSARILLVIGAILLAVEGTWSYPIHTTLPFALYIMVLLLSLALTVLNALKQKAKIGFILNHLGIFLIVWAAFFGAPDVTKARMSLYEGESSHIACTDDGMLVTLPYDVGLEKFEITYYADGKHPKQFSSTLLIDGKSMTTAVNAPCSHRGYAFFQSGYDTVEGRYTVLQVVRDPWLPIIYIGMVLLAVGSILMLFGKWNFKIALPVVVVLTLAFTILTLVKINFGTLMPALRSWWFVPHLFIYMVAYALMAFALVMWLIEKSEKGLKGLKGLKSLKGLNGSELLLRSSSALLIIGMLCGSVWARQAWGDYWGWDSKENWAAVTWFLTLLHLHYNERKNWKAFVIIVLAFLALQITWYGVNYLPSAANSLHTYTQ